MDHNVPYHMMAFNEKLSIGPHMLKENLDDVLEREVNLKLVGKCSRNGLIRKDSVVILSRSIGYQQSCHFNGHFDFDVQCVADVCRPLRGDEIFCTVVQINTLGLLAKAGDAGELHIIAVRNYGENAKFFMEYDLQKDSKITVEVIGSKMKLNDDKIIVLAKITKVHADDDLEDYPLKTIQLTPPDEIPVFDFITSDTMAQPRPALGWLEYGNRLKQQLGKAQELVSLKSHFTSTILEDDSEVDTVEDSSADWRKSNDGEIEDVKTTENTGRQAQKSTYHGRETSERQNSKRRSAVQMCNLARSLSNEFELVGPPGWYDRSIGYDRGMSPSTGRYRPINRAFFKMWEMLDEFELLSPFMQRNVSEVDNVGGEENNRSVERVDPELLICGHLAEAPGAFVEACVKRVQGAPDVQMKNYVMSLEGGAVRPDGDKNDQNATSSNLIEKHFGDHNPNVFLIKGSSSENTSENQADTPVKEEKKTKSKKSAKSSAGQSTAGQSTRKSNLAKQVAPEKIEDSTVQRHGTLFGGAPFPTPNSETGNILHRPNLEHLSAIIHSMGGAHLMTADMGFDFSSVEESREQSMQFPIFAEMYGILICQRLGGCAVLKMFDIFTNVTAKLIAFMISFYDQSFLTKPYTSRTGNPEKYLILKKFRGIDLQERKMLATTFDTWTKIEKFNCMDFEKNTSFVSDINASRLPVHLQEELLEFNRVNVNQRQMRTISTMINYLKRDLEIHSIEARAIIETQLRRAAAWYRRYDRMDGRIALNSVAS